MNKLGMLIGFVVCFSLFSQIGFSNPYDLEYTGTNITLNRTNETQQTSNLDVYGNSTYIISVGSGFAGKWNFAFFNWDGAFTGNYVNNSNCSNGLDFNGTYFGCTGVGYSNITFLDKDFNQVGNMSILQQAETIGWINDFWIPTEQITDRIMFYNTTGSNIKNISVGTECSVPLGVTSYFNKIYLSCNNGTDRLILRYDNITNNYEYSLNLTDNCSGNLQDVFIHNSNLYAFCDMGGNDFIYEYSLDLEFATGWGNVTNDATDAIQNLLGLATHEEALMLFSVGWSAFFGLLAVMVVKRQVIILFTSIFMIGIMAFSWVGWLPSIFTWIFVIIAGLLVAMKVRTIWVGGG